MSSPFNGTSGADIMLGTSGDDVFLASSGDDRIWGGAGGTDRLTLTGALSDYTIRDNGDGSFTLTDLRDNGDGVGFVRAIDIFQFSDVSIRASNLLALGQNGISGTSGNDTLLGTGRDDRIEGGAGNDALWGGSGGDDTAVFSGASSDYTIKDNGNGSFTIKDLRGLDGVDTIRDIETLQFSDGAIATSEFIDRKPLEIAGTTADDIQLGTAGNDVFLSSGGNDRIWGGTGGDDLMKLSGNFADYVLRNNGDGSFTITDTRSGLSDGTDVVRGIGSFQFADRSATLAEFEAAQSFNIVRDGQGTAGSDILLGSYGDDILYGNGGMDRIWGGMGGEDTVVFDGAFADYVITDNVNGAFTVKEIRDGATTTAVVRDVEHFQFSDGIVEAADVANGTESLANILRGTAADEYVHGAHTDGLFDAHTNDYMIGNAGADLIRGGAGDDYILGDSLTDTTEHVYTVIPDTELPHFEFEPGLFQAING